MGSDRLFCSRIMLASIIIRRIQCYFLRSYKVQTTSSRLYIATFRPKDCPVLCFGAHTILKKASNRLKHRQKVCSLPILNCTVKSVKNLDAENILWLPKRFSPTSNSCFYVRYSTITSSSLTMPSYLTLPSFNRLDILCVAYGAQLTDIYRCAVYL